jgi:F-type H+-transporting ATPase subunit a
MALIPEAVEYDLGSIPTQLMMAWVVWIFLFAVSIFGLRKKQLVPGGVQNAFEAIFEYVFNLADDVIGHESERYYPLLVGLFIFILAANLIGLIPGFVSPTSDPNLTAALAFMVFLYYNFQGIRKHGFGYVKHFLGPKLPIFLLPVKILMAITELIGAFARPFSLAMRLFCNIFSKEMLLGVLGFLLVNFYFGHNIAEKLLIIAPLLLRPFVVLLGLVVGLIQALIFVILTVFYISGAVHSEE